MAFADDWDAATDQLSEAFGESLTLIRGAQETAITAETWDREYEATGPNGILTIINARDALVAVADYTLAGAVVQPRQGDKLTDANGRKWEVLPIAGRPAFERHGDQWLLRTKEI